MGGQSNDKKAIASLDILADLGSTELDAILRIARRVRFASGEVIMREGELGDAMYLFVEGEVNVSKELTLKVGRDSFSQAEKSMTKLKSGPSGVFGDMAMFGSEPRSATITASGNCVLYEIKRSDFESLCDSNPALGVKLLRRIAGLLCDRLRKSNGDVLKLSTALSLALSK